MTRATWNGVVIAESEDTLAVEGNHYFPSGSLNSAHLRPNDKRTNCPWKGVAHYYDVVVGDEVNEAAAWFYPEPLEAAESIRDRVAFWRGIGVE